MTGRADSTDDLGSPTTRATEVRIPPPALALLAVTVAAGRIAFAADRRFFNVSPDGPASFGVARWLSGTGPWHMFDLSTWRPGYSTLLAPLFWFTRDSEHLIRSALVLNAVLAGASTVVLALIASRLFPTSHLITLFSCAAIALAPATIASSAYVWAESAVTLTFLCALWWTMKFFDRGTALHGTVAVISAVAGATVHARLLPLLTVVTSLTVARALANRDRRLGLALASLGSLGLIASNAYTAFVVRHVWSSAGDTNTIRSTLAQFRHPVAILDAVAGQTWYQLAASASIVGIGAIVLGRAASHSVASPGRTDARIVIAVTLPLVLLSMVFTAGRGRPDQLVYGRYNDSVVWPIVTLGVGWLLSGVPSRRTAVSTVLPAAALTIGLGVLVATRHGGRLGESRGIGAMVPGVLAFGGASGGVRVTQITIVSVSILAVLVTFALATPSRRQILVAALTASILVGVVRTHDALAVRLNGGADSAASVTAVDRLVPPGTVLGVRFVPDEYQPALPASQQLSYALFYEWALPSHRFRADFGRDDVGPYVFAPDDDPLFVAAASPVIWRDPYSSMVLWYEVDGEAVGRAGATMPPP